MCKAMEAANVALVVALTTTMHVRYGVTMEQFTLWSVHSSERVRSQEGLIVDTFNAFALKYLKLLPQEISERKAAVFLADTGVPWKGVELEVATCSAHVLRRSPLSCRYARRRGGCGASKSKSW